MNIYLLLSSPAFFFSVFLLSCGDSNYCNDHHWSYSGFEGPDQWHVCHPECGGDHQSPIDIAVFESDSLLMKAEMSYESAPIRLLNNGHTLVFEYPSGSNLSVNEKNYDLKQFHFHTPSEHLIQGKQYPMEIHLVHQSTDVDLAVVSILVEIGEENEYLGHLIPYLPPNAGGLEETEALFNPGSLFPTDSTYFTYAGSLTTPDCSEVVSWYVFGNPIEASASQINSFSEIMGTNSRPVQEINDRMVYLFE